jgi:hypothetical protein
MRMIKASTNFTLYETNRVSAISFMEKLFPDLFSKAAEIKVKNRLHSLRCFNVSSGLLGNALPYPGCHAARAEHQDLVDSMSHSFRIEVFVQPSVVECKGMSRHHGARHSSVDMSSSSSLPSISTCPASPTSLTRLNCLSAKCGFPLSSPSSSTIVLSSSHLIKPPFCVILSI